MKKFSMMLAAITVAAASSAYAQYEGDALRFSQTNYGASARIRGLGGAQIGLGGDISSMGGNPAGMGLFTRSEFAFTPEFNQTGASAQYLGQSSKSNKGMLNLSQLGVAWYNPTTRNTGENTDKGLLSVVLGINYNRNNDFSAFYDYAGTSSSGPSVRNFFAELANENGNIPTSNNFAGLPAIAYDSFLINYGGGAYNIGTSPANSNRINDTRTGSVSELNFNVALNFSNQFYIGGSLGLVNTRYMRTLNYMETGTVNVDPNETTTVSNPSIHNYDLSYRTSQESKGSGINARIGMIFRPTSDFRIGATLQTPTWFTVEDIFSETVDNRLTKQGFSRNYTNTPDEFPFTYNLRTPLKGSLGASYIIAGTALISADIDYVDYASMVFNTNNNAEPGTIARNNTGVKNLYKEAVNYRFGAEYKIDLISLRAGYGVSGSPFQGDDNGTFDTKTYSGGLGYRVKNYSIDLAYQYNDFRNSFTAYALSDGSEPVADVKTGKNNVFLTVGLRF
ncbi:OmpP1/FadL family transporter [Pedobacter sp. SYP-B3415]|uniref:OmpP1/FadL family transporter n=1 Tax=Pedobacter sp. SYP-B3415 TaxID=2496641 RepID=UPI00101BB484|nr:outer membrane protein transport protein [Pedobacter sp. SYP-B3415]